MIEKRLRKLGQVRSSTSFLSFDHLIQFFAIKIAPICCSADDTSTPTVAASTGAQTPGFVVELTVGDLLKRVLVPAGI